MQRYSISNKTHKRLVLTEMILFSQAFIAQITFHRHVAFHKLHLCDYSDVGFLEAAQGDTSNPPCLCNSSLMDDYLQPCHPGRTLPHPPAAADTLAAGDFHVPYLALADP